MNKAAILEFRNLVDRNPDLHSRFFQACWQNPAALAALAQETGFDISEQDVIAAVNEARASGDLTDVELELVSGGGQNGCQVGDPITDPPRDSSMTTPK
jgi:predicted ribosomally synthesized peptide with nif11-like leader